MSDEEFYILNGREVVVTPNLHVKCDGGNAPLGHPIEYMTLEKGNEALCNYCGRRYVHMHHRDSAAIRENGEREPAA